MNAISCSSLVLLSVALQVCTLFGGAQEVPTELPTTELPETTTIEADPAIFYEPEKDIVFYLYTPAEPQNGKEISLTNSSWIQELGFNAALPLRVTIHGWLGDDTSAVNRDVREAFFQKGQFNVIRVDWSAGAGTINYALAQGRVKETGHVVGSLIRMIANETTLNLSDVIVIGHSLGGHVAGFAGKNLTGELGAIVGLDPALPLFDVDNPEERLDASDAKYVQVIHTNGGMKGVMEPFGDADFYPNGGRKQPGCGVDFVGVCAHGRAPIYYAESINSAIGFWGHPCEKVDGENLENCDQSKANFLMGGEPLSRNAVGVFNLTTNAEPPYAQGRPRRGGFPILCKIMPFICN